MTKRIGILKLPSTRMAALELMRQINYGYDPTTERVQRVLEIAEFTPDLSE